MIIQYVIKKVEGKLKPGIKVALLIVLCSGGPKPSDRINLKIGFCTGRVKPGFSIIFFRGQKKFSFFMNLRAV